MRASPQSLKQFAELNASSSYAVDPANDNTAAEEAEEAEPTALPCFGSE